MFAEGIGLVQPPLVNCEREENGSHYCWRAQAACSRRSWNIEASKWQSWPKIKNIWADWRRSPVHGLEELLWKTRCITCYDVYSLCLPNKKLEANLHNHAGGSRHIERVLPVATLGRRAAMSGKRGRRTKSSADCTNSSQKQLHAFFGHVIDSLQVSPRSIDREECKMLMCWGF